MGLAQIRDMPGPDAEGKEDYDQQHYLDHLAIIQAIQTANKVTLSMYPIWPVKDFQGFLSNHQQLHVDMMRTRNLAYRSLLKLDPKNDQQRMAWSWQNYAEHAAIHQSLLLTG